MKVICPHCNVPKEINDVVAGIRVKCAACQSEFVAGGSPPPQDSPSPVSDNDNIERIPCVFCQHMVVKDALKCPNCKGTIGSVPCPSCRESVPANTISCPHCQTQIRKPAQVQTPKPQRKCPTCENLFPSTEFTCQTCKVPLGPVPQSKLLCAIIAIAFPLGIHRFLMGYPTIGIIQVLVVITTCGAASLWPIVEGILILAGNLKMADGRDLLDN